MHLPTIPYVLGLIHTKTSSTIRWIQRNFHYNLSKHTKIHPHPSITKNDIFLSTPDWIFFICLLRTHYSGNVIRSPLYRYRNWYHYFLKQCSDNTKEILEKFKSLESDPVTLDFLLTYNELLFFYLYQDLCGSLPLFCVL